MEPLVRVSVFVLMDAKARDQLKRVHGRPVDATATDETEHFYVCAACGQAVNMRSFYQVFHHEEEDHKPLSEAELAESSPTP